MKNALLLIIASLTVIAADPAKQESKPFMFTASSQADGKPFRWQDHEQKAVATIFADQDHENERASVGGEFIFEHAHRLVMQLGTYGKGIQVRFNRAEPDPVKSIITSDFEPVVTKVAKGWEITFKAP